MTANQMENNRRNGSESRCRWLGETPAMVVWRLVHPCPLLENFAQLYRKPSTPVATQQCLKPLEAIDEAKRLGNVHEDWAVLLPDDWRIPGNSRDLALAFSLAEATQVFGGLDATVKACRSCPANAPRRVFAEPDSESLAGCSQVLVFGNLQQLSNQTQTLSSSARPLARPTWLGPNIPPQTNHALMGAMAGHLFAGGKLRQMVGASTPTELWQRLWFSRESVVQWDRARIVALLDDLRGGARTEIPKETAALTGWDQFCTAACRALEHGMSLESEYIPSGFADGRDWWLSPHCSHCGAAMVADGNSCQICGRSGGPIPEQKRRIMGWSPYRPLHTLLSSESAERLMQTASVQRDTNS